jgi:uncharacterized membrane protein YhiD involved in acid resistance
MAAGASRPVIAVAATVIVLVSLWPLRIVSERLERAAPRRFHVHLRLTDAARMADLLDWLAERRVDVLHFDSERDQAGHLAIDLTLGLPSKMDRARLMAEMSALDWIALDNVGGRPE